MKIGFLKLTLKLTDDCSLKFKFKKTGNWNWQYYKNNLQFVYLLFAKNSSSNDVFARSNKFNYNWILEKYILIIMHINKHV